MRTVAHHTAKAAKRKTKVVQPVQATPLVIQQNRQKVVHFSLDQLRYALPVSDVLTVERAVQITPVPKGPASVTGVINFHGAIIPVIDLRKIFGLPPRAIRLEDRFIIARTPQRLVVLVADSVAGVADHDGDSNPAGRPLGLSKHLSGMVTEEHGIILLADLTSILSPDEQHLLEQTMAEGQK